MQSTERAVQLLGCDTEFLRNLRGGEAGNGIEHVIAVESFRQKITHLILQLDDVLTILGVANHLLIHHIILEKLPMTEKDVEIVRALLQKVQPHQIYVAGDLADPHGTHKKCTDAVLAAIDEEKKAGAEWLKDCRIWMYRGAWAEWEIENIEMCVPLSPEELRAKRNSILKHQSQMESAPFLGNDERLFWQRAEDRNRATASLYDQLGLACYEAMEAFVEYKPL